MKKSGIDADRIDPEFLVSLADPLERVYEAIQLDLMKNIARRFTGQKIPKSKVKSSDVWRAYQLEQIGGLTRENIELIAAYSGDVSELTQMALRQSIETAISVVEPELARAVTKPDYIPQRSATTERVLGAYQAQAMNRYNMVNTVMLNSSLRAFREIIDDTTAYERKLARAQETLNAETGAVIFGSESWTQALYKSVRKMAADGLTGFIDAAGHQWTAQSYVMMDIRTTAANTARQAVFQRNEDYGNHFISVSQHPGARPLCVPWQGGVYSTNGWSGVIKDGNGKSIDVVPLESTSYGQPAGLFGINCGHMSFPFIPGVSVQRPRILDDEENRELYRRTQEQRYMERKIRKLKTEADVLEAAGDKAGAKELRAKARGATADLREWCDSKGMPYYPDRVRVIDGKIALQKASDNAILNAPIHAVGAASPHNPLVYDPISDKENVMLDYVAGKAPEYPPDHTMAGYKCKTGRVIDELDDLVEFYQTSDSLWQKEKARYWVYDKDGNERQVELHWYQHHEIGRVEHKIKLGKRGQLYVDEWDD